MRDKTEIDAVFFDAGGTLLYISPSVGKVYTEVTREMGVEVSDSLLEHRLHDIWEDYAPTNTVRDGDLRASDEKDREMWKTFLRRLYEDLEDLQALDFEEWFQNVFDRFGKPETFQLYPETRETLEALNDAGYKLGVVSNWDSRLLTICRELGVEDLVDFILPSAVAGYRKPSPEIFKQALEKAEVNSRNALHVGDKELDDYRGSKSVGLTPVLLDRNDHHEKTSEKTVISSLDQLPTLLNEKSMDSTRGS